MSVKVLLVTTVKWPSAGRLAGAFASLGCVVDGLLPAGHPAAQSRYFERRYPYKPLANVSSLRDSICESRPDLLIALDDRATTLLVHTHEKSNPEISALIEHSLGDLKNYAQLMSRTGFIKAANAAKIRTPETHGLASETDLDAALNEIGLPAVLKADGTWGGEGVFVVRDRDEAIAAFRKLSDPPSRLRSLARAIRRSDAHYLRAAMEAKSAVISIQKFIAGKPATTSFACWQGKLLAANHLEAVATQEANGPASVLERIESPDMDAAAERLAERFNLTGLHGLDYIRDDHGGTHLIEINPRATQSSYLSFGSGHDLVGALVSRAGGYSVAPRPRVAGDIVALFPQEWMRDPASPYLKSTFHDVPWDDPALMRAWMSTEQARPVPHRWESLFAGTSRDQTIARSGKP